MANKSAAEQKNIMPEVNAQKNIDPVFTDADKTAWVFTNLIFNTIRYFTKIRLLRSVLPI